MAHLLGNKSCLECLARDIEDIQKTIDDCMERSDVTCMNIQSWKFPDKLSHELVIEDLLKVYTFSDDPQFDSLAHIVLFELVIDRLVFLVQIVTQYLEGIFLSERAPSANGKKKTHFGSSMSIGLAVKKFWNKTAHIHHTMKMMKKKDKENASLVPQMKHTIADLQEENGVMRDVLLSVSGRSSALEERSEGATSALSAPSVVSSANKSIVDSGNSYETGDIPVSVVQAAMSKSVSNAATQTFDTAFVSCEACAHTQQNLIDVGTAMIALCESQGLPSSLAKQKKQLKKSLMAVADISRWKTEQNRDIERINKHLEFLYNEIEPLKLELEKSRQLNRKFREQVKEQKGSKERAEMELVDKEKEFVLKMDMLSQEHNKNEGILQEELKALIKGKANIEDRLAVMEKENINRKKQNHHLEKEVARITENLTEELSEKERLKNSEKELFIIRDELSDVREKLADTEIELGKAQTENRALTKHGKTIQAKQEMLLQRASQLDQECEQLQNRLAEIEDERERLLDENEALKNKNEIGERASTDLRALIDQSSKDKSALEHDIKLLQGKVSDLESEMADATKQLTLLSEFPVADLSIGGHPAEFVERTLMEKRGSSLHDDLAKQVKANNIRIAVLEERNDYLRQALARYEESSSLVPSDIPKDRVLLWDARPSTQTDSKDIRPLKSRSSRDTVGESTSMNNTNASVYIQKRSMDLKTASHSSPNPTPPSQPRTVSSKMNEKRQVYSFGMQKSRGMGIHYSLSDASIVSKGQKAMPKNIDSENDTTRKDDVEAAEVFCCAECDKVYTNGRDLQIHKSFCYGRT